MALVQPSVSQTLQDRQRTNLIDLSSSVQCSNLSCTFINQIWSNMCRTINNMPTHFPELQPVVPEIWLNETLVVFTVITATWPRSPRNSSVPNFTHPDWVTRRCCELPVWTASCIANWANSPHRYLFWWYSTGCRFFPDLVTFLTTF